MQFHFSFGSDHSFYIIQRKHDMVSRKRDREESVEADWPAARRRVEEVIATVVTSQKRELEDDETDAGRPAKRQAFDSSPSANFKNGKRPREEEDDTNQARTKRQPQANPLKTMIQDRLAMNEIFRSCKWNQYLELLNRFGGDVHSVAVALADSPEKRRLRAIKNLKEGYRNEVVNAISDIQIHKHRFDPYNIFPSIVTQQILSQLLVEHASCLICRDTFIDCTDVIWKYCKQHLMHVKCFRKKVAEGDMPLFGHCDCIVDP
jgi:hypothetical protein